MSVLAESYMRIALRLGSGDRLAFGDFLETRASTYALELFRLETTIEVRIEDGSTRIWVKVIGSIAGVIIAYGGLRTGIDYIARDAPWFSDKIFSEVYRAGVPPATTIRTERRLGTAGKLRRLLARIDTLKRQNLNRPELTQEINAIRKTLQAILDDLDSTEERKIVEQGILSEIDDALDHPQLPLLPPEPRVALPSRKLELWTKLTNIDEEPPRRVSAPEPWYDFDPVNQKLVPRHRLIK